MAEKLSLESELQALSLRERLAKMGVETTARLKKNFAVQKIYPEGEVYPGWFAENAKRAQKQNGKWYSTGEGIKSFHWQVVGDEDKDGLPHGLGIDFFYNAYLRYAELGVGAGRKVADVQRTRTNLYTQRYIAKWNPKQGHTHRPVIRQELRHLAGRFAMVLVNRIGKIYRGFVLNGLAGLNATRSDEGLHGSMVDLDVEIKT